MKKIKPVLVVVEDHVDSSQQAVEDPRGVHPDPEGAARPSEAVEAVEDVAFFPVLALTFCIHHKLEFF